MSSTAPPNMSPTATAKAPEEPKSDMAKEPAKLLLFGFDISRMEERSKFLLLAGGALFSALLFAALQEKVFAIEGFHYSGFMTALTTGIYAVMGALERATLGEKKRKADLKTYAILSIATFSGMFFTNWSLKYLTYPTRVVAKGSKVVPVMIASVVILGKKYSISEYLAAVLLVAGIALFTLADAGLPSFNLVGVFLISIGVAADAVTCNLEERWFFRRASPCTHAEVIQFSSLFGLVLAVGTIAATGELWPALDHALEHPEVFLYTTIFSACGYSSVAFILLLIKEFSATVAELVKSCRKVLSIALSFIFFAKPISTFHIIGGFVFVVSIAINVHIKASRKKTVAYAPVQQKESAATTSPKQAAPAEAV